MKNKRQENKDNERISVMCKNVINLSCAIGVYTHGKSLDSKNALEYNVYRRCLCYFLNQATMAEEQEFIRFMGVNLEEIVARRMKRISLRVFRH